MKINFLNKALISLILISSFTEIIFLNNNNNNNNKIENSNVTVKQIESGVGFSGLVLNYDNSDHLYMWGRNDYGQLGIGNTTQQITPQEVDINQDGILGNEGTINSFLIGGLSNLLWSTDSSDVDHLYSWGKNDSGSLGIGQSSLDMRFSPIPVEINLEDNFLINGEQTKIQKIAISEAASEEVPTTYSNDIVITKDINNNEHLYIWGDNTYGQLGNSEAAHKLLSVDEPFEFKTDLLETGKEIEEIEIGSQTIGMVIENSLYTWGSNQSQEMGIDEGVSEVKHDTPSLVNFDPDIDGGEASFDGEVTIKQIDFSKETAAAVLSDANRDYLYTWGDNLYGQLGEDDGGDTEHFNTPQRIENISNDTNVEIKKIFTDPKNIAVIIEGEGEGEGEGEDKLLISGNNTYGQFGRGDTVPSSTSQFIECNSIIEDKIINLSLNFGSLIINTIDDSNVSHLYSWGKNNYGQLGVTGWQHYTPQELKDFIPSPFPKFSEISTPVENPNSEFQMKVDYLLSSYYLDNNFFKENYINKIEVVDGIDGDGRVYGSINSEDEDIPLSGSIDLDGLTPGNDYSSGDLYLKVTYNDNLIFGDSTSTAIPEFTAPKNDAALPTFVSANVSVDTITNIPTGISYNINIPSGDPTTKDTVINKIEVTDGTNVYGSIEATADVIIEEIGIIPLNGPIDIVPGTTYNNLYLKVTLNDNQEIGNIDDWKVGDFDVPKLNAESPSFNSATTFDVDSSSVFYDLDIPSNNPTTEPTIINKIEVTNGDSVLGYVDSTKGEIPNSGNIILENLDENTRYEGFYLVVYYNDSEIFNESGQEDFGKVPTINNLSPPSPPTIASTEVFDITSKSAIVKYEISIPPDVQGVERTILTKISIIDSSGNIYGEISDKKGLNPIGEIELTLKPSQTYEGLYLEVIYNGKDENHVGGSEIESSLIPSFKTKINPMIIYGSGALLILIIILIIIIIIASVLRKKAKTEKNYHINKSKR